jgi:hypothetical protein
MSFLLACSTQKEEKVVVEYPAYEMRTFRVESEGGCANDSSACASYEVTYPVFAHLSQAVLDSITKKMHIALDPGNPGSSSRSFDSMGAEFVKDYEQFHADFSDSPIGWFFDGEVEVDSMSSTLICLVASSSYYTGGAHGGYSTYFINIDPSDGTKITLKDRFKEGFEGPLRQVGERLFNEANMPDDSIASEGFSYEFSDGFALNDNYGFTREGLRFVYNIYEIAPYAAGSQEIVIPYERIKTLLK